MKTAEGVTDGWGKNTPNQMRWRTGGVCVRREEMTVQQVFINLIISLAHVSVY